MTTLLRVDASPRGVASVSRRLTDSYTSVWLSAHPGGAVVERDLYEPELPHLSAAAVEAMFVPPAQRTPAQSASLELSDLLVDELAAADEVVLGTPMWNFSLPSVLKAWIDHVVRVGRTFTYDETGRAVPLLSDRRTVVVSARGGSYLGDSPSAHMDHQTRYLRDMLAFLGLRSVEFVHAEGVAVRDEAEVIAAARDELRLHAA